MLILLKIACVTAFMFMFSVIAAILNSAINANNHKALQDNAVFIIFCVILSTSILTASVV